jgi:hypothetical protein
LSAGQNHARASEDGLPQHQVGFEQREQRGLDVPLEVVAKSLIGSLVQAEGEKMSSTDFPEPPEEFLKYPAGNLIALMTDGDAVAAALDDLTRSGFPRDKMFVLTGPAGAERLDVTGQHHGLRGRVYRTLGQVGDEHEELIRAADHLQAGGLAVRVPADKDDKAVAARILGEHGAVHIVYMGKATYETLEP